MINSESSICSVDEYLLNFSNLIRVAMKAGEPRKFLSGKEKQLGLYMEAKAFSFITCYFICCQVLANQSNISKSGLIKVSRYV